VPTRRFFLESSGALAGLAAAPLLGSLAGCESAPTRTNATARSSARAGALPVQTLSANVQLITEAPGNVVALSSSAGLLLVDSGSAEKAAAVKASLGGARVRTLFNTHHHSDQTGGNELFGGSGAIIHAHEIAREWLATDYYVPAQDRWVKALSTAGIPTETFRVHGETTAGTQRVEFGYLLEAHTRGDIYVYLRDADVLCVGDVASPLRDPVLDWYAGGWLGARVDAMDRLLKLTSENTRIVPAYGPVMTRADLQAERDMLLKIYDQTSELMMTGRSAQDMLDAGVMNNLSRTFHDPYQFLYDVSKGLWAHYTNFGGRSV
jgi:glyoxylase-like metal-dependent hydrolase (beta-lactamase superfamily II)